MRWVSTAFVAALTIPCAFSFLYFIIVALRFPFTALLCIPFAIYFGLAASKGLALTRRLANGEVPDKGVWNALRNTQLPGAVFLIGVGGALTFTYLLKSLQVVEHSRVYEAKTLASKVKEAQDQYLLRHGHYAATNADLAKLGLASGALSNFGMRFFSVTTAALTCGSGKPGYKLIFKRLSTPGVPPRYGEYTMVYDSCSDKFLFGDCRKCSTDFLD